MSGICRWCQGSSTQHKDPDGCWCPRCLRPGDPDSVRCRSFTEVDVPAKRAGAKRQVLNGAADSVTQFDGGDFALPKSGTRRREAYDVIRLSGRAGLTFEELCSQLGRSYSVVGPRVRELVSDGWVVGAGRTREASSGAQQDVWIAVVFEQMEMR